MKNDVRYFLIGSGDVVNVARVVGHTYEYLDPKSGRWVPHTAVVDFVTFDPGGTEISEKQAKRKVAEIAPDVDRRRIF